MTKIPSVEQTAKTIVDKVRYFATCHQYPDNSEEAKAYLVGVNTATAMLYIDLIGTSKVKGFLTTYAETQHTALLTEERRRVHELLQDSIWPGELNEHTNQILKSIQQALTPPTK